MTHRSSPPGSDWNARWNLLDNAAKFDTSGAPIDIRVADGVVEVLDRGPGIPADEEPHLFDRFYRPVSSRSLPGSGLGLAIVKDVAESAGGRAVSWPSTHARAGIGWSGWRSTRTVVMAPDRSAIPTGPATAGGSQVVPSRASLRRRAMAVSASRTTRCRAGP